MHAMPGTAEELEQALTKVMLVGIYGRVTAAACRRQMEEPEIAAIERGVIDTVEKSDHAAHERPTFEIGLAHMHAAATVEAILDASRTVRRELLDQG